MTIHILPPEVASRIAAGEVVERPASVVKEMLENALDAGARSITVEVQGSGARLIRIADDGSGLAAADVPLAFARYATSKLRSIDDLEAISTFGFRGEALASIASVSQVTMTTRTAEESSGMRISVEGGHITRQEPVGAPRGTLIDVENLFYNVPARLKFLKNESTERQHIAAVVSRYAIAYPEVRFRLIQNGQEALHTSGGGDLLETISQIYGLETASQLVTVEGQPDHARPDLHPVSVTGYTGVPSLNRNNRGQIALFVNGRWVQDASLNTAVVQAYHTLLMQGRYPVAFLFVGVPHDQVDVNVHPTKAQVRFRQPNAVFSAVQRAVRAALLAESPAPQLGGVKSGDLIWGSAEWSARRERLAHITGERMRQLGLGTPDEANQPGYRQPSPEDQAEEDKPAKPRRSLPPLRVVGQVGATYIVAEGPEGLFLLDQHAAHERVLYEQFMAEMAGENIRVQQLLEPLVIELPPDQMALFEENQADLFRVGFEAEGFGRGVVRLSAVPSLFMGEDPAQVLLGALDELACGEMPGEAAAEQKLIARVCKRAAIKAGQTLSLAEMQALVRQLEACAAPRTCPHGRPTMLHLSAERLAKEFGRLGAI